jgi:hypothetical protein
MIKIISDGETGVGQAALAAAFLCDTEYIGYVRAGYITCNGPCEKLKHLNCQTLETDRLRDCAQKCIDECNGVLIFRSGECSKIEDNVKSLIGESRPVMEFDFLKPIDPRSITVWLLTEGITKLYVTGRNDTMGLDIFYNKALPLMTHIIKDINNELERKELDNKRKAKAKAEVKK